MLPNAYESSRQSPERIWRLWRVVQQLRQAEPASLTMWTKFSYALAAVLNGQWRRTNGAKADLFASLAAPEELQQSVKKTSAYLGMASLMTIGSHRLTKTEKSYYRVFGYAETLTA